MALLWLIKVTSISLKAQFSNYPVSDFWLGNIRDSLVTPYSPYYSQVEIILALTERVLSPLTSPRKLLSSVLQLLVQCNVRVTAVKLYPKFPRFTLPIYI